MEGRDKIGRPPAVGELALPWLVCTHGGSKHKQVQTFYSASSSDSGSSDTKGGYLMKSIPELRGKKILMSSCHQNCWWLLLQDRKEPSMLSLLNLETWQAINLPPLPGGGVVDVGDAVLSMSPACDACLLLLFFKAEGDGDGRLMMVFCRPARPDCRWVTQPLGGGRGMCALAPLNGVIYGIDNNANSLQLHYFEEEEEEESLTLIPSHIRMPDFDMPPQLGSSANLVGTSDCLYYVGIYLSSVADSFTVKVCRLDLHRMAWVQVNSLDGHALFLSNPNRASGSTWCSTSTTTSLIEGNSIYFHPCSSDILWVYNLVDQTLTTLSPFPPLLKPADDPFWVVPHHHHHHHQQRSLQDHHHHLLPLKHNNINNETTQPPPRHDDEDDQSCPSLISKLPLEIIELISNRMHLFDYWSFRVTCKTFSSDFPAQRTNNNDPPSPLFMIFKFEEGGRHDNDLIIGRRRRVCKIMDPCRGDSRSNNMLPLPIDVDLFTLEFAKNGWVLYSVGTQSSLSLRYINVFTGLSGCLPPILDLIEEEHHASIAFSTYPTSSDCLTVAIYYPGHILGFRYLRHGDEAWNSFQPDDDDVDDDDVGDEGGGGDDIRFVPSSSTPIFLKGAFYYLDKRGYLGRFELVDDGDPTWQVYERPPIRDCKFHNLGCLAECEGELYSVFVGEIGSWVQVFWFDHSQESWVEIHHMHHAVLFISYKSSVSIISSDERMSNKIFLPRLKGNSVVSYSQDTMKFHILGGHDDDDDDDVIIKDLHGTKEPSSCCWI